MTPPAPAKRAASATPPLSPSPAPKGTTARVLKAAAKPETIVVTDGPVSPAPGGNEWLDNQVCGVCVCEGVMYVRVVEAACGCSASQSALS